MKLIKIIFLFPAIVFSTDISDLASEIRIEGVSAERKSYLASKIISEIFSSAIPAHHKIDRFDSLDLLQRLRHRGIATSATATPTSFFNVQQYVDAACATSYGWYETTSTALGVCLPSSTNSSLYSMAPTGSTSSVTFTYYKDSLCTKVASKTPVTFPVSGAQCITGSTVGTTGSFKSSIGSQSLTSGAYIMTYVYISYNSLIIDIL